MENIENKLNKEISNEDALIVFLLIIIALLTSLQSCASILNTTDYLEIDVSVWTNAARKMQEGKIIYKDIFDHKGPVLYFLYYISYSLMGIKGIGFLEFVFTLIDVFIIYMIGRRLELKKYKSLVLVILCMTFMSYLYMENPCTESIGLTFILIALYCFIRFVKNNQEFTKLDSLITRFLFRHSVNVKTKFSSTMGDI